ncbi:hypothetical protein SCHIN_v1c03210 [Spiroplasma chinense]|uniref:Uncharacterized protein n=1 Tax=Spiroplasma chinense TaxID=216932 RepID=A0A5B9Y350_9MOLU|nr:hypothetical protein [Spiroplasma chinense]QEH61518.1 hypothetical protein SCHIN_v1c03210 [Spiroplasma chinense]
MQKQIWNNLLDSSNKLVKNFEKAKIINVLKDFSQNLVEFSEVYSSNREEFYKFIAQNYNNFFVQSTNIISSTDSVAVIMQLNEGINDYIILINLFRQMIVTLDSLSSEYWLKLVDLNKKENPDFAPYLIKKANSSRFEKTDEELEEIKVESKQYGFKPDQYFEKVLNKELWSEVKKLEETILSKPDGDFEYFKELLSQREELADDMIINLWAVLAINISYLDYLNNLTKG